METLQVLPIGSRVRLRSQDAADPQPGLVTGINIRERGKLTYEVVWWSGGTRNIAWVEECEVDPGEVATQQIGFKG